MFAPTRDQARQFFFDTWSKYRQGTPLSALEKVALDVVLQHAEYHRLLEDTERYLDRDYTPEAGELNPFLHLSLHLAIEEQLSIDQPRGIRERYDALVRKTGDEHEAKHVILECLGETMWAAQRAGMALDEAAYLRCMEERAARRGS